MLLDAEKIQNQAAYRASVCIIGAGVAGLAMALEFDRHGIETVVLESGGFEPDDATRDLSRGDSVGIPYHFADGCRSRFLGGSSNCWGGWCRPLDAHDFERRDWVPDSGWPFSRADIEPYYARAHEVLKLGPVRYGVDYWLQSLHRSDLKQLPLDGGPLADAVSQFSPPVRMGIDYRTDIENSRHVTVLLRATVTQFSTRADDGRVTRVIARTLGGKELTVEAGQFVLATGGIENARLLLAASPRHPGGLGNGNGLVGRYFMEHPRVGGGTVQFNAPWRGNKLYDHRFHYQNPAISMDGVRFAAQLMLRPEVQREHGLLNSNVWFESLMPGDTSPAAEVIIRMKHRLDHKERQGYSVAGDLARVARRPIDSLGFVVGRLLRPPFLVQRVRMVVITEPNPERDSRVILSQRRDALGMPRATVDWRLGNQVKRTMDRSFAFVAQQLEASGVARVQLDPKIEENGWPSSFSDEGTWHHMGTTRMNDNPRLGVVDSHCRMHEVPNLHVAGSSVFPTSGANYPTLTLAALAIRLADRLRETLADDSRPVNVRAA